MREAWFRFWSGPRAGNDHRPWHLFSERNNTDGNWYYSWNDGGRYFNWVLYAPGMLHHGKRTLRIYFGGRVFWLPPWRNPFRGVIPPWEQAP